MWFQWNEQKDYMENVWKCGAFFGHLFVIINLFGQLIPSGFIMARKYVQYNLYILFGIVVLQVSFHQYFAEVEYLYFSPFAFPFFDLLLISLASHDHFFFYAKNFH